MTPQLAYRCRQLPDIKMLTAETCKRRRGVQQIMAYARIGHECEGCLGPLPIDAPIPKAAPKPPAQVTQEAEKKVEIAKTWDFGRPPKPHKCLKCGETDPAQFYGDAKSECRKCAIARYSKRQKDLGWCWTKCPDCGKKRRKKITKKGTRKNSIIEQACSWCKIKGALEGEKK